MVNARLATLDDRDEVIRLVSALLVELGGTPQTAEAMTPVFERLVSGGDDGFIALGEVDGLAVAVCTASFVQSMRTAGRHAVFQEMHVEPHARSSGVGAEVLRFALDHAVAKGCRIVELGTPRVDERPIQFYERNGFEVVGARLRWTP